MPLPAVRLVAQQTQAEVLVAGTWAGLKAGKAAFHNRWVAVMLSVEVCKIVNSLNSPCACIRIAEVRNDDTSVPVVLLQLLDKPVASEQTAGEK